MQNNNQNGKTIELFLVNGTFDGIVTAELSNWNGKAIKIPRTELQTSNRLDIKGPGVYFLFCTVEDGNKDGKSGVYIGEAENVADRLLQHIRDHKSGKEPFYWHTAIIFIGNDLNKAYIRYLEHQLVDIAKENSEGNDSFQILTKNTYKNTVLKESQISALETFICNIRVLISTLGYRILETPPKANRNTIQLYCQGRGGRAQGFLSRRGFTVLKGSRVSNSTTSSFEKYGYFKLRQKLETDGIIIDNEFQKDYEFASPSAASSVVKGNTTNGNIEWKTIEGTKLKDLDTSGE